MADTYDPSGMSEGPVGQSDGNEDQSEENQVEENHDSQEERQENNEEKIVMMQCRRRTGKSRELNPCGTKRVKMEKIREGHYRYECTGCGSTWNEGPHVSQIDV
jgi:Na+-translocating ferredoxin:NAD+ oxidoreductase RNF subunit RnfB